jgi:chromosome segregation ATPase
MEGHSSRLEEAEDRFSELEDEMEIKGKTKELLVRQLKTCKRNIQELTDSIKRPSLRIMGIEEGDKVQAKRMHNIFNKIITENFPSLQKQPRCPTLDEWIKKMWYLYTMDYYTAMKKNEMLSFSSKWMELENIILSELGKPRRPKITCSPSYVDFRSRANTTRGLDFDHMTR